MTASEFPAKDIVSSFNFLVSLVVRLIFVTGTRTGSVETKLANAARDVFTGAITTAAGLRQTLESLTPNDVEFRDAFAKAKVSNAKLARYYLRSLEMAQQEAKEPWFKPQDDKAIINLEHVLPTKPEGNWPQFSHEEAEEYANRIGNQVLLLAKDNAELRSAKFEEKRKVYERSPFTLTAQVASTDTWTPAMIESRQKALAAIAVKTWRV